MFQQIWCVQQDVSAIISTHQYLLPYTKQRWVTAAVHVLEHNVIVCGDRGGTVHVYDIQTKVKLGTCIQTM